MFEYEKFGKLFLLTGKNLDIKDGLTVRHPTIKNILDIDPVHCETLYQTYTSLLVSDPYSNMVFLDDNGIDYEKTTPFDVLLMRYKKSFELLENGKNEDDLLFALYEQKTIDEALLFYFGEQGWHFVSVDNEVYIASKDNSVFISKDEYNIASSFVRCLNGLNTDDEERIKPSNDFAKQMLIDIERDKIKYSKRNKSDSNEFLARIILESEIPIFDIEKYSIFHIIELAKLHKSKMMVNNMVNGYYNGVVDSKDITPESLDYTK